MIEEKTKTKRKKIKKSIEIPQGISIEINGNEIIARKNGEEIKRKLNYNINNIKKEDNKIIISGTETKKDKRVINSLIAHIKNMISGLKEKFVYRLEICSVHFPMSVSIQGDYLVIKNFLGERKERKAKILPQVNVKIEKNIITVESSDKEKAGQTAANIERATRIRKRDRRIFQDGIWLVQKSKGAKRKNE